MSAPQTFDEAWPDLSGRLRGVLVVRGVPAQDRDDVIQETALRVYRAWESLDPERPVLPFVITVALNFWRDMLRERARRGVDLQAPADMEIVSDHDVERVVLARQELAHVTIAMQRLPDEQRQLLFATDEFADKVRPLRAAERIARMRVRRQIARAVGRASAVVGLVWLRRPGRTTGVVATAYVGAMAAVVMTSPTPAPIAPDIAAGKADVAPIVQLVAEHPAAPERWHPARLVAAHVVTAPSVTAVQARPRPARKPTHVCSPQQPPDSGLGKTTIVVPAVTVRLPGANGKSHPLIQTPEMHAQAGDGCVDVQ